MWIGYQMMATSLCPNKAVCGHSSWATGYSVLSVYLTVPGITHNSVCYPECHIVTMQMQEGGQLVRRMGHHYGHSDEIMGLMLTMSRMIVMRIVIGLTKHGS